MTTPGTTSRPWWQTAVIYQIYPRSFQDTTGNGIGDLPGVTARLDYLAGTLDIDAIWLAPFQPSPMADFGYDISDYCDVDPLFGTLADFDELVAAAHQRGIRVIIDWVPNHTADQHPWFQESRASPANPKRDWYTWRDPDPEGGPPNNWLSVFGGSAWEWDEESRQYYLHSFLASQPDLNWRNPAVRAAMHETLRFWLDRGVDGFRIDVAHYLMKDPDFRDNPPAPADAGSFFKHLGDYERYVHRHSKGHTDVHEVYRDIRTILDGYEGERFSVGEIHVDDFEAWAAYYGEALDELHMPYNFSLLYMPWDAGELRRRVDAVEAALPPGAWPNHVFGNHDESRIATRFGPVRARAVAVLLLTLRGTPTMYYGDELGMGDIAVADEDIQDPWGLQVKGQGRDGCRSPMRWTGEPGAGFTDPDIVPWLPVGEGLDRRSVAHQLGDPASMLQLYRRLLNLRREAPALRVGEYRAADEVPHDVFAYHRTAGAERYFVALNTGTAPRRVKLPSGGVVAVATWNPAPSPETVASLLLPPDGAAVLRLG
jgi:glycosidase